jgi:hypothetical protein
MRRNNSTRHGTTLDRRRLSRLAMPASLATVASVLVFGQATADTHRDDPIPRSANATATGHAAESPADPVRAFHTADAAERWFAARAAAEDSRGGGVVRLSSPAGAGITSVDVGDPGQSVGDYLVFNHPVLNQAMTQARGDLRGHCVFVEDTACEGDVTFELAGGLVTVEGPFDLTRGTNVFAVTGGTGAYQKARGVLTVRSTEERNDYILRVFR